MKTLSIIAIIALLSPSFASETAAVAEPVRAEVVLNEFIATYAKENSAWKSGIEQIADVTKIPAGKQLGQSTFIGFYAFRPKLWSELTSAEKKEAVRDPRLSAFIISRASAAQYPVAGIQVPRLEKFPIEGTPQVGIAPTLLPVVAAPPPGPVTNIAITAEQLISEKTIEVRLQ
jgi:hypothetical protein